MKQIHVHHHAYFRPDGTCRLFGVCCWQDNPRQQLPGRITLPDEPPLYARGMDDDLEHWCRLVAEVELGQHPDAALRAHANHQRLRHTGGIQHPQVAHVRVGGTLAWTEDSHPWVHERAAALLVLPHHKRVRPYVGIVFAGMEDA